MRFGTKAIHAGQPPCPATGAVMFPVYMTSTYVQQAPGKPIKHYEYSRTQNPTREVLENSLAALEDAKYGLAFASGLAALSTTLLSLHSGDHVICCDDVYGGTYRALTKVFNQFNLEVTFIDGAKPEQLQKEIKNNSKLFLIETPTNPALSVYDLKTLSEIAHSKGLTVVADNTFASPYLQQPLKFGADLVLHSTTKYLGGHSDVIGGSLMTNNEQLFEKLKFIQNAAGAVPGPMDCFLVLRGIKTLHVRMERHCDNAEKIAKFFSTHPEVESVRYPGLANHPQHELAKKQMRRFGGMITFALKGGFERNQRFVQKVKLIYLAESLGGVESLISHPFTMSHVSVPRDELRRRGITESLLRFSVGIEDADDLIEDIERAMRESK
ncbi:MAG: cystathionine gamma-synthase [Planctomycetes bacterium]|nr:cystathionine gamma-synthase [Planctomycetota bacterium]